MSYLSIKAYFSVPVQEKKSVLKNAKQNSCKLLKSVRIMHKLIIHIFLMVSEYKLA